jgi:hypothetical protein
MGLLMNAFNINDMYTYCSYGSIHSFTFSLFIITIYWYSLLRIRIFSNFSHQPFVLPVFLYKAILSIKILHLLTSLVINYFHTCIH